MDDTVSPAAPAPIGESVADTSNTNSNNSTSEAAQPIIDLGLTNEQAQQFKAFMENSGGFEKAFGRVKSAISNPQQFEQPQMPTSQPQPQPVEPQTPQTPQQPVYTPPEGSITAQEFLAQQYFQGLSRDPKYEAISDQIASGDVLKEMASFNIQPLNQDGSINDMMVRRYLDLKAQTVPAKATSTEPNASSAPTVDYIQVADGKIANIDQAYAVLQQDAQLKAMGQGGHPDVTAAEEFIKNTLNPQAK